ncbi:glycerophosphoryl diester phosphodiesterase [Flavobacteriaceae bacterium MAR_2010_72]|nr:glycerophosphoryl diester phosphodiesterase [Flavobacteriaceae bacterium MAR_2010_72]TVZ59016.1 glycerophosphoryl diester phosphodiesterase [Flavobacteriaceae bacterium MAR_2010_105]
MKHVLYLLSFMVLTNCNSNPQIDVQGHRGFRGLFPENSIIGFKNALDAGVHTLEMDVVISKDHKVVLSHDPFMNHEIALDPSGDSISMKKEMSFNLYQMTYDSIMQFDCGSKPHLRFPKQQKLKVHKPLLDEVITMAEKESKGSILYNIEIKSLSEWDTIYTPKVGTFVDLVLEVVTSKGITDRTTLQSFDVRALENVKQKFPEIQTALLVDEFEKIADKMKSLSYSPEIISPYFKLLDAKTVKELQAKGFKVIPWTINKESDIELMISYGVDGIISDYPDIVLNTINVR